MCLVKTLLDKTQWEKNLVKEKEYTYLIIRIMDASLKTLQGKPSGTKPCEGKRGHRVLTPPYENINSETRIFIFQACASSS